MPVTLQRAARYYRVPDIKHRERARIDAPKEMTPEAFARLQGLMPTVSTPIPEPMSVEEFRRKYGNGPH